MRTAHTQLVKSAGDAVSSLTLALAEVGKLPSGAQRLMCGETRVAETRRDFLTAVANDDTEKLKDSNE